jgi:hypothetical protein
LASSVSRILLHTFNLFGLFQTIEDTHASERRRKQQLAEKKQQKSKRKSDKSEGRSEKADKSEGRSEKADLKSDSTRPEKLTGGDGRASERLDLREKADGRAADRMESRSGASGDKAGERLGERVPERERPFDFRGDARADKQPTAPAAVKVVYSKANDADAETMVRARSAKK